MTRATLTPAQLLWDTGQGVPFSSQFGDVYHTASGALAQTRHVFMQGCGLPGRWQSQPTFAIIETGFGLGLNFLATWLAWQQDPLRCGQLHFVSVEAYPVTADDIVRAVSQAPDLRALRPLALALAARYPDPQRPGVHRLCFAHPDNRHQNVTLTLALGDAAHMLPQLRLRADAAYFDGFSPAKNPQLWQPRIFKAVARLLKPQALAATWSVAAPVRKGLTEAGFIVSRRPGLPPKRDALQAIYQPWALRGTDAPSPQASSQASPQTPPPPSTLQEKQHAGAHPLAADASPASVPHAPRQRHVAVIGAGLAGAAACWAMARRGWRVTLVEAGPGPACGASGLPVGLCVPHVSPDGAVISRLTQAGVDWMRQVIELIDLPRHAWRESGVWQVLDVEEPDEASHDTAVPNTVPNPVPDTPAPNAGSATAQHTALARRLEALGAQARARLPGGYEGPALRHARGLSIKGEALVRHWLEQCPGLDCRWNTPVRRLERTQAADAVQGGSRWRVLGGAQAPGQEIVIEADAVVVATALDAPRLLAAQGSGDDGTPPATSAAAPMDVPTPIAPFAPLTPLRGQITLGRWPAAQDAACPVPAATFPGVPSTEGTEAPDDLAATIETTIEAVRQQAITGHGHFIANWTAAGPPAPATETPDGGHDDGTGHALGGRDGQGWEQTENWDWAMGSSFERGDADVAPRLSSDRINLAKLRHILPGLAPVLAPQFESPLATRAAGVQPWAQVRATTLDRLPLAGAVPDWSAVDLALRGSPRARAAALHLDTLPRVPGLYLLCGLGARGLSLASLCAELIASQIAGEPWPLEAPLAHAMDPARLGLRERRQAPPAHE